MARFTTTCNGGYGSHYHLYLDVTENSYDVASNTSNVTINMWAQADSSLYGAYNNNSPAQNPVSLTVDGVNVISTNITMDFRNTQVVNMASWQGNVGHNSDGAKTLSVSGSFSIIGPSSLTGGSISGDTALTTIPRTSNVTCNTYSQTMGSNIVIYTNRASTSFTHILTCDFGKYTVEIANGVADSYTWTIPLVLADQIPNSTSGVGTIYCKTYNGNTLIGTSSVGFTATVPSNIVPSASITSVTEAVSGIASQFGAFIQGKSKLSIQVSGSGSYGSTIKSYSTTINGSTYSQTSFTTGFLWTSGTNTIKTTVTDTRNRTATTSFSVNVSAYSAPNVSSLIVQRCNSDGSSDTSGTCMKVTMSGNITSLSNKNNKNFYFRYKKSSDSSWTTVSVSTSAYSISNVASIVSNISTETSYDVMAYAVDYFGSSSRSANVPTAFALMDWHNSGTGIAFGKVAESSNLFDVGLNAKFRGTVHVDGDLNTGDKVAMWADTEGGNIQIRGGDNTLWEMDAYNGNFRIFNFTNTSYPGITIDKNGNLWMKNVLYTYGVQMTNYSNALLYPLKEGNLRLTTMSDGSSFNIAYQKTTSSGWDYNYLSINPTNKKMTVGVSGYTVTYDGTPVFSGTPNFASNTVTFNSGANINNPSPQQLIIGATSENNYKVFLGVRDSAWRFCPNKDNLLDLGAPNYRWQKIYCSSSAISTSDRNQKKDIYDLNDKYIELFMKLQPVSYKFIDGTSGRTHVGFISQDVEEAMFECGLTDLDFAGFCRDPKTEIVETEIDGEIVREERVIEGEYLYSLRYEEFIALNTAVIQYNRKRITDLENKLNKIAEMLNIDLSEI